MVIIDFEELEGIELDISYLVGYSIVNMVWPKITFTI
jgi:hypothetical protein